MTRDMPCNLEAEMCVVGSCIVAPERIAGARGLIQPEDFWWEQHRLTYEALVAVAESGTAVDLVTLKGELSRRGQLDRVGGVEYLVNLAEGVPSACNLPYYCGEVVEASRKRRLIQIGASTTQSAYNGQTAEEIIRDVHSQLLSLTGKADDDVNDLGPAMLEMRKAMDLEAAEGRVPGMLLGYEQLDAVLEGIEPGDLLTIAGATGGGKTSLAAGIALQAAQAGVPVIFFSLEMKLRQMLRRFLQSEAQVDGSKIKNPAKLWEDDWREVDAAIARMQTWKLRLVTRSMTVPMAYSYVRQMELVYREPVGLIVADYGQLFEPTTGKTREQEVSAIVGGLKKAAMDFDCPVIMLSQFSRAVHASPDVLPELHHLRESGRIEQDSSQVILLHFPTPAQARREQEKYMLPSATVHIWARVAKSRNGTRTPWQGNGAIRLVWEPRYTRFTRDMVLVDNDPMGAMP